MGALLLPSPRLVIGCHRLGLCSRALHTAQARSGTVLGLKPCQRRPGRQPAAGLSASAASSGQHMEPEVEVVVEKIHAAPIKVVVFVTGGATQVGCS